MGCISTKLMIARSISFHEERKQRSQRTPSNSIPLLEDLIISNTSGSDQYLALVCAATTVSNKLYSNKSIITSNTFSKLSIEPDISKAIDKLDPSSSARQVQEEKGNQFESDHKNRSKSWHCFPEDIVYSLAHEENSSGFEDKHDHLSSKSAVGSRSFHTVEEYDDMVNRILLTKSQIVQQSELNDEADDGSVTTKLKQTDDKDSAIKEMQPPSLDNNYSLEEREIVKEINIPSSGIKIEEGIPSHKTRMLESDSKGVSTKEKGNKRKAIAKRLESLRVPSNNNECPAAIASLREWLPADGIYSHESYVTPKFGSYSRNAKESSEDSIFSPELVSAFEQCMQKLEAEEENILRKLTQESGEGMQTQERTSVPHHA